MKYTPNANIKWLGFEGTTFELESAAVGDTPTQQRTLISIANKNGIANSKMQYKSDATYNRW